MKAGISKQRLLSWNAVSLF